MTQFSQQKDQPQTAESAESNGQEPVQELPPAEGAPDEATSEAAEAVQAVDRESALAAELAETRDRLLRTLAEMENLRRRTGREMDEARRYAVTGFARDLLDVADNLSRALGSVPPEAKDELELVRNLAEGVAMTEKALLATFERHQIAKVVPEIGERFDHNRHQAMFEIETDQQAPGTVAQVLQPGYVIADRLLRPAMVGVAKAPAARADDEQEAAGAETHRRPANDHARPPGEAKPGDRLDTRA